MWDPFRKGHYCDRCDCNIRLDPDNFHLSFFGSGGVNVPPHVPRELNGFGFHAPMFCSGCAVDVLRVVQAHCKEFKAGGMKTPPDFHREGSQYNDTLDPTEQVDAEEAIAAFLFDKHCNEGTPLNEAVYGNIGRSVLRVVLERFRPDLFTERNDSEKEDEVAGQLPGRDRETDA